jgi:branched-subunit amino acid aminotransferase/4-amino-4-deoxychorismate lyase
MGMFLKNGEFVSAEKAVVSIENIEFQYGFGVYENLKVRNRTVFFPEDHVERLKNSAQIIGLEHSFSETKILNWIRNLVKKEEQESFNIKMLLIGSSLKENAELWIISLNPFFPKPSYYSQGIETVTVRAERAWPKAKTLSMLHSYLAYREAKRKEAYDAVLVDPNGIAVEGTRTNLFGIIGKTIVSPPRERILDGVTRKYVLRIAEKNGFLYEEKEFTVPELLKMDSAFLTSTSSKILPIRSIDGNAFKQPVSGALKELMKAFDDFLEVYAAKQ